MAPLTWRNVDAPDLSAASNAMARASQGITGAFKQAGDIGRGIYADQVDIGSREAMQAAQKFATSADWSNALASGTAYGNMDPRFINAETLRWGGDRRRGLLGEEQIVQNMEIQRNQEARAQQAHALRLSGGGGGGGGGRRSGRGGGRSGSTRDADSFAVAQAEAARRVAVAEFGENSPEALAATSRLAEISTGAKSRSGLLDAADAFAGAIKADRAEAVAAGDAAVAAMSGEGGFNPYAIPLPSASPAAGIPGATLPLAPSAPAAAPVETPAPAPVDSGLDWGGFSMGTPVNAPAPTDAPPAASIERPNLSFGSEVPPMEMPPAAKGRPLSWSQYAQEQLGDAPTAASPTGSAVSMGMPAAVEELPQWSAYQADVAAFEQSAIERAKSAAVERDRVKPNTPTVVRNNIDTARATIDRVVEQNPEFALNEYTRDFRSTYDSEGPAAVATALAARLGMSDVGTLQQDIMIMARDNGVDFATAAGAIATAGGPASYRSNTFFGEGGNFWDYAGPWNWSPIDAMWSTEYYNQDEARRYMEIARSSADDPRGRIGQRNELGSIRSELAGIDRGYALRMEAEVRARAIAEARPNDARAQRAYADAHAATLEADKAAVAFRRNLNERLGSIGMTKGVGARPNVDDYITPEMREQASVLERERAAEAAANMETFGVARPTYVGFQQGIFDPGNVPADSAFGLQQANRWLGPVLSGRARDNEKESFFEWVAASPAASREIFARIQDMEYAGEDVDLPESVEKAYEQYTQNRIPEQAISDLTALGFDLSAQPELAVALTNNPTVREKLRSWRNTDNFWTFESTKASSRAVAQGAIRAAMDKIKKEYETDTSGKRARPVIQRNGAIGFTNEAYDENYWRNMMARG